MSRRGVDDVGSVALRASVEQVVWARMAAAVVTATVLSACADPGRASGEPSRPESAASGTSGGGRRHPGHAAAAVQADPLRDGRARGRAAASGRREARCAPSSAIPALGVAGLDVVPYRGRTDDSPGTVIQDRGHAATPHGPRGGVGPGGVGNYQVTAHRTSSTRAFARLPELRRGDRVVVTTRQVRYVYRVVQTRRTSFRSAASLAGQRAAVPGRPGARATRAMITLSTCATPEDHAAGNYWSAPLRTRSTWIDKISVLVGGACGRRPADPASTRGAPWHRTR